MNTELVELLRDTLLSANEAGLVLNNRTHGHNFDCEVIDVQTALDLVADSESLTVDEIHDFIRDLNYLRQGSYSGDVELEHHSTLAYTCGDGCCSEYDSHTLIIFRHP